MRFNRGFRAGFILLFALMLPLQGYAAMPVCREGAVASSAPHAHCAGAATVHHHNCDNCCCGAAMVPAPTDFLAPRLTAPDIADAAPGRTPAVALDRLDRPPRFIAA
jgi:hypothetical protein